MRTAKALFASGFSSLLQFGPRHRCRHGSGRALNYTANTANTVAAHSLAMVRAIRPSRSLRRDQSSAARSRSTRTSRQVFQSRGGNRCCARGVAQAAQAAAPAQQRQRRAKVTVTKARRSQRRPSSGRLAATWLRTSCSQSYHRQTTIAHSAVAVAVAVAMAMAMANSHRLRLR